MSTAAGFFAQFPPPGDDHSRPDGYWCGRHWAPSGLPGVNALGATSDMLAAFITGHCPPNTRSRAMLRRQLAKAGHVCCRLGDERMHEIWGRWVAADAVELAEDT